MKTRTKKAKTEWKVFWVDAKGALHWTSCDAFLGAHLLSKVYLADGAKKSWYGEFDKRTGHAV